LKMSSEHIKVRTIELKEFDSTVEL